MLSTLSPLIANWVENKFKWKHLWQPKIKPFIIPPGGMIRTDPGDIKYPEGVFLMGGWYFDHPMCGVRLEAVPNLDTERFFTIARLMAAGITIPTIPIHCRVPPDTLPGYYQLASTKEYAWQDLLRFHVFNEDTVGHYCLGFGYTLAVLDQERPTPSRQLEEEILKSQQELMSLIKARGV